MPLRLPKERVLSVAYNTVASLINHVTAVNMFKDITLQLLGEPKFNDLTQLRH